MLLVTAGGIAWHAADILLVGPTVFLPLCGLFTPKLFFYVRLRLLEVAFSLHGTI